MEGDFRIEQWLVQPQLNTIVHPDNAASKVEPKVMEVLVCLADHADEVVSKEAIFQSVWPETFVTDDALIRCIVELRKVFEDDVREHTSRQITTHGGRIHSAAVDPSGRIIVTADIDGLVRAGPATGEDPHLLPGHTTLVWYLAVSHDSRWIASSSDDALYLWPMPDVTKPPLHKLPHGELMTRLRALTNLQVVEDKAAATGWKLEVGPFPGWKDVPTW